MHRSKRHLRPASVERDLARLADGTLDPSERERVEGLVAGSADLQARLREQRYAVAATRSVLQHERAPLTLHLRRPTLAARHRPRGPRFAVGAISATGVLLWTLAVLGGSQAGLTVAQAAAIAERPGHDDRRASRPTTTSRFPASAPRGSRSRTGRTASPGPPRARAPTGWAGTGRRPSSTGAPANRSPTRSCPASRCRPRPARGPSCAREPSSSSTRGRASSPGCVAGTHACCPARACPCRRCWGSRCGAAADGSHIDARPP